MTANQQLNIVKKSLFRIDRVCWSQSSFAHTVGCLNLDTQWMWYAVLVSRGFVLDLQFLHMYCFSLSVSLSLCLSLCLFVCRSSCVCLSVCLCPFLSLLPCHPIFFFLQNLRIKYWALIDMAPPLWPNIKFNIYINIEIEVLAELYSHPHHLIDFHY